jgi:hypothetical protein
MSGSNDLRGYVVVSHGADLSGVEASGSGAGTTIATFTCHDKSVHLVPYGDTLAVITDPDAPPIGWLAYPLNANWLLALIRTSADLTDAKHSVHEAYVLLQICRSMGSEDDVETLHRFILRKARELTNADAGTLYLIEEHEGERRLRFAVSQTGPADEQRYTGSVLALSDRSVAGGVGLSGRPVRIADVYTDALPTGVNFDSSFDRANDYHTKSLLCVPMHNMKDEIVGVIELLNRKPIFAAVLSNAALAKQIVMPFDGHDQEILTALAAQAGVVLENSQMRRASRGVQP